MRSPLLFSGLLFAALCSAQPFDPCDSLFADFSFTQTPNGTQFHAVTTGQGSPTTWYWVFGDNTASHQENPFHTFPGPGTYEVCFKAMTVYHVNGVAVECEFNVCHDVVIAQPDACDSLFADFSFTQTPDGTQFHAITTGQGSPTTWYWVFGDNSVSHQENPFHIFPGPGTYEVCFKAMTVYHVNGVAVECEFNVCHDVVVTPPDPCEDLEVCIEAEYLGNNLYFFGNCSNMGGPGTSYFWSFGDGSTSSFPNADHLYTAPGTYDVCLTVMSGNCVDTTCTTVTITGGGDPCEELEACFEAEYLGNNLYFFDNCSSTGGPGTSYFWSFGDGSTSTFPNADHAYPAPGTYTVCLTAMSGNCVDTTCTTVTITGGGDPCEDLEACIEMDELGNNMVLFSSCSSTNGLDVDLFWSFGDGSTDTLPNVEHFFPEFGTYTVCLTVLSGDCVDSTCTSVTITNGGDPCEGFEACFVSDELDNGTYFFDNCSTEQGPSASFLWLFGDGTTSSGVNADHHYQQPGTYSVCLLAMSGNCADSTCTSVVVTEGGGGEPCEGFEACFVSNDLGNGNYFFDNCSSTLGNEASFLWLFGDGTTSTTTNAEHHFAAPGTYNVCLIAMAGDCVDSTCTSVTITGEGGGCEGFSNDFDVVFGDVVAVFTAFSTPEAVGHLWNFGDGSEGSGEVVEHYFPQAGPYEVCLHSWYWNEEEMDSCWATTCRMVDLFGTGVADASGASGFQLYPQPAEDHVTISGPASLGTATVRLFGMDGRLERQERVSAWPHVMDLSGVGAAVHLLRIDAEGVSFQHRVIVR